MAQSVSFAVRIHQANYTFSQLRAIWQEADRLGYDGATLYDLLSAPCLECWTTLTALTALTDRLRPIPLVLSNTYRHPAVLAKMAASLDVIAGGRLILGLGAGGDRGDHRAFGIGWESTPRRVDRLEDAVRIMRALWRGVDSPLHSRYYGPIAGPVLPPPVQRPGPPILIGGHGERYLLRAAARVADLCNIGFDLGVADWEAKKELLARYCREAGRDPASLGLSHNATVILADNAKAVQEKVEIYARDRHLTIDDAHRRLANAIVGTPKECIERIQQYAAKGITWFFLLFPDLPALDSLRMFAQTVLPAFQRTGGNATSAR